MSLKQVGLLAVLLCVVLAGGVFAAAGGIHVYVQGQPIAAQAIVQQYQPPISRTRTGARAFFRQALRLWE